MARIIEALEHGFPKKHPLRELGVTDAVIFAGFVEDIAQVYRALDVFVYPSLAEPLGTSLLAAMGWGLPVVAVASGGVPEYVEDGVSGLLVERVEFFGCISWRTATIGCATHLTYRGGWPRDQGS
jgi:glycosyltransferase involved in cell wall biosynthesis